MSLLKYISAYVLFIFGRNDMSVTMNDVTLTVNHKLRYILNRTVNNTRRLNNLNRYYIGTVLGLLTTTKRSTSGISKPEDQINIKHSNYLDTRVSEAAIDDNRLFL